jgi:serine/threonine-protein kinase
MAEQLFLGRYRAVRQLGEGGMGRVFLARRVGQTRDVVVKVLHEHLVADPKFREVFRREIDFMARFRHPHAVEFYEGALDDKHGPCVVMEYVPGIGLDDLLQRHGRLGPEHVGQLLGQLCGVLQAAHAQGIIHRDLKPANIMVLGADTLLERIKVLDFGLAKLALSSPGRLYIPIEKLTSATANHIAGTPEYVCPEQVRGEEMDHRGDLYSVGVMLYELLNGRRPFDRETLEQTLLAHVYDAPPPFERSVALTIPRAISSVVQQCLAKDPGDRPASAWEMGRRYEQALGKKILQGQEPPPPAAPAAAAATAVADASLARAQRDRRAVLAHLQAWMPEQVAVLKLRGFFDGLGAEVVESVPGLIRLRMRRPRASARAAPAAPRTGLFAAFGLSKKADEAPPSDPVDLEVHMQKGPDQRQNELKLTLVLRPGAGSRMAIDGGWRAWCQQVERDLGAYIMAQR